MTIRTKNSTIYEIDDDDDDDDGFKTTYQAYCFVEWNLFQHIKQILAQL